MNKSEEAYARLTQKIETGELPPGAILSEAALIDANGQLVGLKTFAPKFKENDERYEISIKLRF